MHPAHQKATIGTVKSTLKIPPRHNGVVPIKISGPSIPTDTAHFIADASTHKGKDPNISIIEGIHKIKDRSTVNVFSLTTQINTSLSTRVNRSDTLNL